MGRRRFEMFQYRQVLVRLRAGDSERDIARSGHMGRESRDQLTSPPQDQRGITKSPGTSALLAGYAAIVFVIVHTK